MYCLADELKPHVLIVDNAESIDFDPSSPKGAFYEYVFIFHFHIGLLCKYLELLNFAVRKTIPHLETQHNSASHSNTTTSATTVLQAKQGKRETDVSKDRESIKV